MGYETKYELEVKDDDYGGVFIDMIFHEDEISNMIDNLPFNRYCKWYNYNEDIIQYSKKYPEKVFKLIQIGEDHTLIDPSLKVNYYKNGKSYEGTITINISKFNETKLK